MLSVENKYFLLKSFVYELPVIKSNVLKTGSGANNVVAIITNKKDNLLYFIIILKN